MSSADLTFHCLISLMAKHSIWTIGGLVIVCLILWRLWRFTITPMLYPTKPKELPYWVPFIGHGSAFFFNSYKVLEQGRRYFRNSKEPYSITLIGQRIYVVTSPNDVQSLYKNTTTISWLRFVQDLYRWIGFSQPNIDKLWQTPTDVKSNGESNVNPVHKLPPNQMIEAYERHQLLPGENMHEISKLLVNQISARLRWKNISNSEPYVRRYTSKTVTLSLMDWTSDVFIRTATEAYWGKSIWIVAPHLLDYFSTWENTSWKYVFQLPRFLSREMYIARDQLIDAFTRYFRQRNMLRKDTSYFVPKAEAELRDIGFDDNEVAKVHMLQHWAINGNMHKVTFWIFAHLTHRPQLLELIREETKLGIDGNEPIVSYLTENCPRLEAVFLETLRLVMASSLMRHVVEPTSIGGRILEKGNNVMVPYRQLHFSEDVWGDDARQFNPDRFLNRKDLSRDPSYRPFGGGQHLCPGRFVARHAVFAFVALTLWRYDVRLEPHVGGDSRTSAQKFPRADESKPGLGSLSPMKSDEVLLQLTPRIM